MVGWMGVQKWDCEPCEVNYSVVKICYDVRQDSTTITVSYSLNMYNLITFIENREGLTSIYNKNIFISIGVDPLRKILASIQLEKI